MRVAEIDKGFVRAPAGEVFALVGDPAGYPAWWPGVSADGDGLRFPELGTVSVDTAGVREDVEVVIPVAGPRVRGHLQWYLEPFRDGTVVYGITDVQTAKRWSPRKVLRHRSDMRRAMVAMKQRLE